MMKRIIILLSMTSVIAFGQQSDCIDGSYQCLHMRHLCDRHPQVKEYCPLTCGSCITNPIIDCIDGSYQCLYMRHLCDRHPQVKEYCPLTCGSCITNPIIGCFDGSNQCLHMRHLCDRHPQVKEYCPLTCGSCAIIEPIPVEPRWCELIDPKICNCACSSVATRCPFRCQHQNKDADFCKRLRYPSQCNCHCSNIASKCPERCSQLLQENHYGEIHVGFEKNRTISAADCLSIDPNHCDCPCSAFKYECEHRCVNIKEPEFCQSVADHCTCSCSSIPSKCPETCSQYNQLEPYGPQPIEKQYIDHRWCYDMDPKQCYCPCSSIPHMCPHRCLQTEDPGWCKYVNPNQCTCSCSNIASKCPQLCSQDHQEEQYGRHPNIPEVYYDYQYDENPSTMTASTKDPDFCYNIDPKQCSCPCSEIRFKCPNRCSQTIDPDWCRHIKPERCTCPCSNIASKCPGLCSQGKFAYGG